MKSWRAIGAVAIAALLYSTGVLAQGAPDPLPVRLSVDANGVDLASGDLILGAADVIIGQPGAGGLVFGRSYVGMGWRFSGFASVTSAGSTYWVSFGDAADQFTKSGTLFTSTLGAGSTLTYDSTTKKYTYTAADGTIAVFDATFFDLQPPFYTVPGATVVATISTITSPAGLVTTFNYSVAFHANPDEGAVRRLQSITSSAGYMLHLDYAYNDPSGIVPDAELANWWRVVKVTGINLAVEFCGATAYACALTGGWPSAAYGGPNDKITSVTDSLGRQTLYSYIGGKLTGVRWPGSAADNITIGYGLGGIVSVDRKFGTWSYNYVDSAGNRTTTVTDPASKARVVVSSVSTGLIASDRNETGDTTSYLYDPEGRLTRVTAPEGNQVRFTYDARGNATEVRRVAKAGSGLADIVTSATFPLNTDAECSGTNKTRCNKPKTTTDAGGFVTNYVYNATHGGVTSIKAPAPQSGAVRPETRFVYAQKQARYHNAATTFINGAPAWMLTETSACATTASCNNGADETVTTIAWPAATVTNNLMPSSTTIAAGNGAVSSTTAFIYTEAGDIDTIDGPLSGGGDTTRFFHNTERQQVGVIGPDPDGGGPLLFRAARTTYASTGLPTTVERGTATAQTRTQINNMAVLEKAQTAYDTHRRPVEQRIFNGATSTTLTLSQTSYDALGRVDCVAERMNAAQFAPPLPSACTLDTAGAFGPDRITKFLYDEASRWLRTTNAFGTSLEQVTARTTAYTNNGLPANIKDAALNATNFTYDGFDRLSRITYPDGTFEHFTYNSRGLVTDIRLRSNTHFVMTFDDLGRMTSRDAPGTTPDVAYAYDNFGRATSLSQTGHALTYTYDQLSRLLSEAQPAGTVAYQYDAAGRRTRITWPGSYYVQYDYDLANAATKLRENGATTGAGVLASFTYDNLGRRTAFARANGAGASTTYGYDGMSRLASLSHGASGTANDVTFGYSYNPASQIAGRTVSNAAYEWGVPADFFDAYTDNNLNQIATKDGAAFNYDNRGNTVDDTTKTYNYDYENRMAAGGGGTESYDPAGRLYQIVSGGVTQRFLYAGAQIVAEYNQSNALQRRFVPGGLDQPLVWLEGSGTSNRKWLLADERGSVIALANATAGVTAINRYDPFGVQPAGGANTGRFRYAGAPWIGSAGLHHMRARTYSAENGRFMQPDPIGYAGGMNLYGYVGNDPVNFTDPFGLARSCYGIPVIGGSNEEVTYKYVCQEVRTSFSFGLGPFSFGGPGAGAFARDRNAYSDENGGGGTCAGANAFMGAEAAAAAQRRARLARLIGRLSLLALMREALQTGVRNDPHIPIYRAVGQTELTSIFSTTPARFSMSPSGFGQKQFFTTTTDARWYASQTSGWPGEPVSAIVQTHIRTSTYQAGHPFTDVGHLVISFDNLGLELVNADAAKTGIQIADVCPK